MICTTLSVHKKHKAYRLFSMREAVGLVSDTSQLLRRNETSIRREVDNLPKTPYGPHGNMASKTVVSVKILKYGLENLRIIRI